MKKFTRRFLLALALMLLLCTAAFAAESVQVSSYSQAEAALLSCIANREKEVSLVGWSENVTYQEEESLIMLLRRAAANDTQTDGSGSDYDVMNVHTVMCNLDGNTLTVHFSYLTSQEQERELDESCREILDSLSLSGLPDCKKVEKIYTYVGTHFVYDDTLTTFSAYSGLKSGKMVCQGYALLMHKLLWAENIPCRIISGTTGSVAHGWNIVQLDGKWYNLDATWDACEKPGEAMTFDSFLRSNANFAGHIPHNPYRSTAFLAKYPIAETDYDLNEIYCTLENEPISGLSLRLGRTVKIVPKNTKNQKLNYSFRSTDPTVAEIDQNGNITAKKLGSCSIFVTAGEEALPSMWKFVSVDLTKASPWAQSGVERYYLAGLLPDTLCCDFQKPITRGELTRLLYPVLRTVPAKWTADISFGDIYRDPDASFIEYAAYLGVVNGTGNGQFSPHATLTREQAAKIICKTAELLGAPLPENPEKIWADAAEIGSWAGGFVSAVDAAGIMQGVGGGRFSPKTALTREQVICMMARTLTYVAAELNAA